MDTRRETSPIVMIHNMMDKYNTIVLDMDGTLLNSQSEISDLLKETLIKLQEEGIKLVLASGRTTPAMVDYAKELEMDKHHGLIISNNGACVLDAESHEILHAETISDEDALRLFDHLNNFDLITIVNNEERMYVKDIYADFVDVSEYFNGELTMIDIIKHEARENGRFLVSEVSEFKDVIGFPLYKVLLAANPDYLLENYEAIAEPFKDDLLSVFTTPFYYEFTASGVDKGNTIVTVLSEMGYDKEKIIAFGDGHNDVSMLKQVGRGIAMGNAEDEVKEVADEITLTNNEDGVVIGLRKYFSSLTE